MSLDPKYRWLLIASDDENMRAYAIGPFETEEYAWDWARMKSLLMRHTITLLIDPMDEDWQGCSADERN